MPRVDLPEDWAVGHLRQAVRDSLMSHGEECILLSMYHVARDQGTVPRCPDCYDDVYASDSRPDCTRCWGTSFDGGVSVAARSWGLFTDADNDENLRRDGVWANNNRQLQTEPHPELWQHDYVVKVLRWTKDHRPVSIEGVYVTDVVDVVSLRTGNLTGNTERDNVGQRTVLDRVPDDHVIYQYPIIGQRFDRIDGKER